MNIRVSPTIKELFTPCIGCIVENSMKIKYLSNMEITDDKLPDMLISNFFGNQHKASSEFISFFKSLKLPDMTYEEIKKLMSKEKMGIKEKEMKVGFFSKVGVRTDHLKNNMKMKLAKRKFWCTKE